MATGVGPGKGECRFVSELALASILRGWTCPTMTVSLAAEEGGERPGCRRFCRWRLQCRSTRCDGLEGRSTLGTESRPSSWTVASGNTDFIRMHPRVVFGHGALSFWKLGAFR